MSGNKVSRIMVVDDDPDLLRITERILKEEHYFVSTASNGKDCLDSIRRDKPHLLLLDVILPDLSGLEVCRIIKSDPELGSIHVLLLSGLRTESESISEGLESGADGYLIKPLKSRELLARVEASFRLITAEVALRESEHRHRSILKSAMDGFWQVDLQGKLMEVNDAYCRMSGYSMEELLQMKISDLEIIESEEETIARIHRIMTLGEDRFESRHRRKDGGVFDVEASVQFHPVDEGRMVAFFHDISRRKETERHLIDLALRNQTLLQTASDGIHILDQLGNVVEVNESFCRMLGYTREEMLKLNVTDWDSHFSAGELMEMMGKLLLKPSLVETRHRRKDGAILDVEINEVGVELDGKNYRYAAARDITRRKKAEDQIRLANRELMKTLAEKDKFFSIIAHDLRSPFHTLLGFTRMMAEELPTLRLDEIQQIALSMRDSANKLYNLLENLLEWSMMQRNVGNFNPEPVSFGAVISGLVPLVREAADKKKISINYQVPGELNILADVRMLESILRNLIFNAVKFSKKGGKILVSARSLPDHLIEISVQDQGIGISAEMMEDLFQLEGQANRKGTAGEPSTGLGLIICKDFVEKHGGRIWVNSEEGKGSEFCFTLKSADTPMALLTENQPHG